jgi:quinol monooxygenase YgiN
LREERNRAACGRVGVRQAGKRDSVEFSYPLRKDDDMPVWVMVDLKVKAEKVDDLKAYMKSILGDTRRFTGCEFVELYQDRSDPTAWAFLERWDDKTNYEKYLAWRGGNGSLAEIVAMLDGAPTIRFFDKIDA